MNWHVSDVAHSDSPATGPRPASRVTPYAHPFLWISVEPGRKVFWALARVRHGSDVQGMVKLILKPAAVLMALNGAIAVEDVNAFLGDPLHAEITVRVGELASATFGKGAFPPAERRPAEMATTATDRSSV